MTEETRSERHGFAFTRTAEHRARTLTAGSIAGMLFGVLFGTCVTIVRSTAGGADETGAWLADGTASLEWAWGCCRSQASSSSGSSACRDNAWGGGMIGSSPR